MKIPMDDFFFLGWENRKLDTLSNREGLRKLYKVYKR